MSVPVKCLATALLLPICICLSGQTPDREHLQAGAYVRVSHVLDGHRIYERLIDSYDYDLYGLSVGLSTRPEDEDWFAHAWNYPDFGLGFSYARMGSLDFKNDSRLGDIANLYGWAEFDLLRTRHFRFGPLLELGLSYSPERYDWQTNPENEFIGSRVFAVIGTGLRAEVLLAPQWAAQAGFYLTHHSNGMLRSPNLGINEMAVGIGLRHYMAPKVFVSRPPDPPDEPEWRKGLQWNVFAAAGVHSCRTELKGILASGGPKGQGSPVPARARLCAGAELMWRYTPIFATGIEAEFGYADNNYRGTDLILRGSEDPQGYSPFRAGLGFVQECRYRQLSVHFVFGAYLYKRTGLTEDVGRSYQKIGARYHFRRAGGLFAGLDMRAHQLDRSYSLEWSLGYNL
ncbi:MAG: acyloxyacyl hydrolase [Bacteroidales bacterium]|jgi:hypothetical protein|nr:acyloxyacyl hydrolase [Bacteroidales bacterium]